MKKNAKKLMERMCNFIENTTVFKNRLLLNMELEIIRNNEQYEK